MFQFNNCKFELQERMFELKVWIEEQQVRILAGMDTHSITAKAGQTFPLLMD